MLLGGATLGQGLLVWRRPCGWALAVNQVDAGRACASVFRDDELDGRAEHTVLSFFLGLCCSVRHRHVLRADVGFVSLIATFSVESGRIWTSAYERCRTGSRSI